MNRKPSSDSMLILHAHGLRILMFYGQLYTITTVILVGQTVYYDYVRRWFRSTPSEGYPVVSFSAPI
jgi:hypothetical protein